MAMLVITRWYMVLTYLYFRILWNSHWNGGSWLLQLAIWQDFSPQMNSGYSKGSSAAASAVHVPFIKHGWKIPKWMISLIKTFRPRGFPSQVCWHQAGIIHNHYSLLLTIYNYISSATIWNFIKQTHLLLDLFGSSTKNKTIPSLRGTPKATLASIPTEK